MQIGWPLMSHCSNPPVVRRSQAVSACPFSFSFLFFFFFFQGQDTERQREKKLTSLASLCLVDAVRAKQPKGPISLKYLFNCLCVCVRARACLCVPVCVRKRPSGMFKG